MTFPATKTEQHQKAMSLNILKAALHLCELESDRRFEKARPMYAETGADELRHKAGAFGATVDCLKDCIAILDAEAS